MSMPLSASDIGRFRDLVAQRLGLCFEDGRLESLVDVLRERLDLTGDPSFESYALRLGTQGAGLEEVQALAKKLTVAETYFFRYRDHFRAFTERVLPDRMRARSAARRLRILSAGCASGEEAYTLAILIREQIQSSDPWEVQIQGVDINPAIVERAERGVYSAWSFRDTPSDLRSRYFHAEGRDFRLDDSVRSMVSFRQKNLVDDDPLFWQPGAFDVVFCRNVMMYFTPEVMRAVVARIKGALSPSGFLFLGHAETLRGVSQDFHLCHSHDTFYYQRREATDLTVIDSGNGRPAADRVASDTYQPKEVDWVGAIQDASDRIELLTQSKARSEPPAPSTPEPATRVRQPVDRPTWDLRPAVEMLREERFEDAMSLLAALPATSRTDPDTQLLRAVVLTNSGQLKEAEQVCHQILSVDDLNAGAHYLMALCRDHAGDRPGARDHDRAATYLDGEFVMPHLHLGLLARRAGDLEQARRELGRALALLDREDSSRILLFGGGFSRETLGELCRSELRMCGANP